MMFPKHITKEEINELPLRKYEGKIVLVTDPDKQEDVFEELKEHSVVGFDTEARPAFKRGVYYDTSLLQLSIPDTTYLIRLNYTGISPAFTNFFADPLIKKVGISIKDDLKDLRKLCAKHHLAFNPDNVLDLNDAAKRLDVNHAGVRKLTGIFLGFRVSKAQQTSNWENPQLTEPQLRYAATDAWVCLEIYQRLAYLGYV
ncbi:3'-5' exonuclease [Tunicatimonas pelagia]|uniref:3'-5' exonuclease n=1 Tax=Tunicatimonas pelagia TaxID=931531 RepID=UPI00266553C6|nr:3'-5' exonuclease [Tunicatimonas pelagia]WKN46296.1 3'-5' exonuclease domain-containing protein 2 [Tunicatimonas pelagia]